QRWPAVLGFAPRASVRLVASFLFSRLITTCNTGHGFRGLRSYTPDASRTLSSASELLPEKTVRPPPSYGKRPWSSRQQGPTIIAFLPPGSCGALLAESPCPRQPASLNASCLPAPCSRW